MPDSVWDILVVVCAMVGALTLWTLVAGGLASLVLRHYHRRSERGAGVEGQEGRGAAVQALLNRRARSWAEMPSWVRDDREWAAAVVLLGSDRIASRTEPFVDFASRRIDWTSLRPATAGWEPEHRLLVEVAYVLAGGRHEPSHEAPAPPPVTLAARGA